MNSNVYARKRLIYISVLVLFAMAFVLAGCDGDGDGGGAKKKGGRKRPPVPVAVKKVEPGIVDIYATYPGRIRGARQVEVQSRVQGILLRRHYNQGELVEAGELLFSINPEPFKARVKQREAQLAKARANLEQAQAVWQRVSHLYEINAVSEARRTEAHAKLKTAQAAVAVAKANLESAQIKLDYTSIEAPLTGVTSLQEVDVGALVSPGTVLTTITQLDPVHVQFSIPAEDALMRKKALMAMVAEDEEGPLGATRKAVLILPSGTRYEQTGYVDFTQSTIDPRTGTVRLRAVFDNSDHELVPGRFVRVRIRLETRENAIVIPNKAIADSQTQTRVYVVSDKGRAKAVPVELGPVVEDGRVIASGLEAGDRVVVIGLGQIRPGAKVQIKPREKLAIGGQRPKQGAAATPYGKPTDESASKSDREQYRSAPAAGLDKQDS